MAQPNAPHEPDVTTLRAAVAATARMLVRAGLIEAFGHVSARCADGMVLTTVRPLARAGVDDTVVLDASGRVLDGPADVVPLEASMHLAVYRVRSDVGAICRGHPRATVVLGTRTDDVPLLHGLGAMAGARVRVHPDVELITTPAAGDAVAATLGEDLAVVLRANGALAVGPDLTAAAVALWSLEDRARVALGAATLGPDPTPIDAVTWQRRMRHTAPETARAARWFIETFGDPATDPTPTP